jgi:DJ-1/PfpI family
VVRSSSGLAVASEPFAGGACDTVAVVGGVGALEAGEDPAICAYVLGRSVRARRIASICSGALILAAAGLLEGRRATTRWRRARLLQTRYPAVKVELDRIFVRDGPIWTSAGITAGIDLAHASSRAVSWPRPGRPPPRRSSACASRPPAARWRRDTSPSIRSPAAPASTTRSACAGPSSACTASRSRRCVGWRAG